MLLGRSERKAWFCCLYPFSSHSSEKFCERARNLSVSLRAVTVGKSKWGYCSDWTHNESVSWCVSVLLVIVCLSGVLRDYSSFLLVCAQVIDSKQSVTFFCARWNENSSDTEKENRNRKPNYSLCLLWEIISLFGWCFPSCMAVTFKPCPHPCG